MRWGCKTHRRLFSASVRGVGGATLSALMFQHSATRVAETERLANVPAPRPIHGTASRSIRDNANASLPDDRSVPCATCSFVRELTEGRERLGGLERVKIYDTFVEGK